jgi:hypothetical protein
MCLTQVKHWMLNLNSLSHHHSPSAPFLFDNLKTLLSDVTVCSPGQHIKKLIVIMLGMHVSLSELEAQQACTASLMSLTGGGSTQVGGWYSFLCA